MHLMSSRHNCAFAMLNFFSVYRKFYETDSRAKGIFGNVGFSTKQMKLIFRVRSEK